MPTSLEYALLSANVYANSSSVRSRQNAIPVPDGWTVVGPRLVLADGFMATAYKRGGEIVLSFAGTTSEDLLDWITGNLPAATAISLAPQITDAAIFYLRLREAYPTASFSFTGHSLGGGLASLMSVYFDKPASVFDEAPFQKSADSAVVLGLLKLQLSVFAFANNILLPAPFLDYETSLDPTGAILPSPTRVQRQANVHQTSVVGEMLSLDAASLTSYLSSGFGSIGPVLSIAARGLGKVSGSESLLNPNAQTQLGWGFSSLASVKGNPIDLHSISLLLAFLQSTRFLAAVNSHAEVLPRIFKGLYVGESEAPRANLLDLLVQRQYRSEGALDLVAADIEKVDKANGLTSLASALRSGRQATVASVLVDAALANAYGQAKDRVPDDSGGPALKAAFSSVNGGLQISMTALGAESQKVDDELRWIFDALVGAEGVSVSTLDLARWTLQSGEAALSLTLDQDQESDVVLGFGLNDHLDSGGGDDILVGYGGADTLRGGGGADVLFGGDGADDLNGGTEGDWLYGGAGYDTYRFDGNFGRDVVQDSDGSGQLIVDGQQLTGGRKTADDTYEDSTSTWTYTTVGNDLIVRKSGYRDQIEIRRWSASRSLGIVLDDAQTAPAVTNRLTGDFIKRLDSTSPTLYVLEAGNYVANGVQAAAADVLTGTSADERIEGLAGNDALSGFEGDDVLDGGDGDDLLFGGLGRDTITGGAGRDFIFGSGLGILSYPRHTTDAPLTSPGPEVTRGFSWLTYDAGLDGNGVPTHQILGAIDDTLAGDEGNVIDAGAGVDWVRAGSGDDVAHGGADNDQVWGLAGDDVLYGDDGDDRLMGDGIDLLGYLESVPGAQHGSDILSGGGGNDKLSGQGGDDTLYGGDDDDVLWGDDSDPRSTPFANHGNDYLDGGDGNDQLTGGGRADVLYGGIGDDLLYGDADPSFLAGDLHGDDLLDGEDGNDQLVGGGGDDVLIGGLGNDLLIGDDPRLAAAYAGDDDLDGGEGDDEMQGGAGNDLLDGGNGADRLFGEKGNDELTGGAGDDRMLGGDGDDELDGGDGADLLVGDAGDDTLYGGDGKDFLAGSDGADELYGEDGDDEIQGGADNDVLQGGAGIDWLFGQDGDDVLDGEEGDDQLTGGAGVDRLDGGVGNDLLWADDGDDLLNGGAGDDQLVGGAGSDLLSGGDGSDSIIDTVGSNHLRFGQGLSVAGMTVSFETTTGSTLLKAGNDVVVANGLTSGAFVDMAFADGTTLAWQDFIGRTLAFPIQKSTSVAGAQLVGGRLDDTMTGSGGASTFWGGQGSDTMTGSGATNTYVFNRGDGRDTVTELGRGGTGSTVRFGAGIAASNLQLSWSGDRLRIALDGGGTDELALVGFNAANALASIGIGRFAFADGSVVAYADLLAQRGFALVGGAGDDVVLGTSTSDVLDGGAGNDTLSGLQGADTYRFGRGSGQDLVADQDPQAGGGDRLALGTGLGAGDLLLTRYRGDLVIRLAGATADSVRLKDYYVPGSVDAVESIAFADGTPLTRAEVDALVQRQAGAPIAGSAGSDLLYGSVAAESIDGGAGDDTLSADAGDDTLTGGLGNDALYGEGGSDTYVIGARAGQDTIDESVAGDAAGVDTVRFVDGITAADIAFAALGNDLVATGSALGIVLTVKGQFQSSSAANQVERFVFADGTVFSADAVRNSALAGSGLGETITGFGTDDTVSAGRGGDTVYGRGGADTIHGDAGNDTLWGEAGDDTLFGDAGDDLLYGGDGNDRLDGGAGLDRLDGGLGNDVYAFGPGRGLEIVVQDAGGVDAVELAAGIAAANVALHRVSSPPAADLVFNGDSLVVQLNGGADQLWIANYYAATNPTAIESIRFADGTTWDAAAIASRLATAGGSVNTQTGTSKANNFLVDHWNDVISNPSPTAGDKVTASVSYRAPATTPDVTLTGTLDLFAVGTSGLDTLRGNDGANLFEAVDDGYGDALIGGKGDDTYRLRATSEAPASGADPATIVATRITELAGEGNDTLLSAYWSAVLPANVENLVALAPNTIESLSINFWSETDLPHRYLGNALDNVIDASAYEEGSAGTWWYAKRRSGGLASVGAFRLDGGAGADTLVGERGADTYVIDNLGDTVVELGVLKDGTDLSIDTVETPFETSLATAYAHVENVTLTGSAGVGATGNAGANKLDGSLNGAANRLAGGAGDDTYVVGVGDVVVENVGEGIDTIVVAKASAGTVRLSDFANVENVRLQGNAGALDVEGNAGSNIVIGSLGDNRLDGGAGDDQLFDQYAADNTFYSGRVAASDRDVLIGGDGNDVLTSLGGDDTLDGGVGDDRLVVQGGSGVNGVAFASTVTVRFGLGDGADTVERRSAALDRFVLRFDDGIDLANVRMSAQNNALVVGLADGSSLSFLTAVDSNDPPNLLGGFSIALAFGNGMTLEGPDVLSLLRATYASAPTPGADLLVGSPGNDTIDAGTGDDIVLGGAGDDQLDGNDGNDLLLGGDGNDQVFGGNGADSLTGGTGNDLLAGGPGGDTYRFGRGFGQDVIDDRALASGATDVDDGAIDSVVLDAGIGASDVAVYRTINDHTVTGLLLELVSTGDRVELRNSQMAWTQGAIERVAFADGTAWDTNAMSARIAGEIGGDGGDSLNAPVPGSRLEGHGGSDVLTAYSGSNVLDGGPGEDFMSGGTGDDTFYVDYLYDRVLEQPGEGIDTVISSVDWTLGANVERLRLTGSAPLRGSGNALDNVLIGNAGANRLDGLAGADAMSGGADDDVYVVDSAGDTVTESAGEGIDSVESLVSFQLGANVENLLLTGTAKTTATGNGLDNVLIGNLAVNTLVGNGGNDRLDGGGGADSMTGGAGDDTYVVDNPSDKTSEVAGGGIDTVETYLSWTLATEVERLVLTDTLAISGTGNASANELVGNVAANVLDGKGGVDLMLGLDGNDTLQDTLGNGAFDGGAGADVLKGGTGAELFAGGSGNDTLTLGGGADLIAFDRGDGADMVVAPTSTTGAGERNDTLSIGRIRYDQIALAREGNDLLFKATGGTDALRFKDWYLGTTNRTVVRLQVVVDTTTDYAPGSSDVLRSSRTSTFDFAALVAAFDAAKTANPTLGDWTPSTATLTAARSASSDTAVFGGALAYRYAQDASLANVGYATAIALLGASGFGSAAQATAQAGASTFAESAAAAPAALVAARDAAAPTSAGEATPATPAAGGTAGTAAILISSGSADRVDLTSSGLVSIYPDDEDAARLATSDAPAPWQAAALATEASNSSDSSGSKSGPAGHGSSKQGSSGQASTDATSDAFDDFATEAMLASSDDAASSESTSGSTARSAAGSALDGSASGGADLTGTLSTSMSTSADRAATVAATALVDADSDASIGAVPDATTAAWLDAVVASAGSASGAAPDVAPVDARRATGSGDRLSPVDPRSIDTTLVIEASRLVSAASTADLSSMAVTATTASPNARNTLGSATLGSATLGSATPGSVTLGSATPGSVTLGSTGLDSTGLGSTVAGSSDLGAAMGDVATLETAASGAAALGLPTLDVAALDAVTLDMSTTGTVEAESFVDPSSASSGAPLGGPAPMHAGGSDAHATAPLAGALGASDEATGRVAAETSLDDPASTATRALDALADAWFDRDPAPTGLALSHYAAVVANRLRRDGLGGDASGRDAAAPASYAEQWRHARSAAAGHGWLGGDASERWGVGSTALRPGALLGADPDCSTAGAVGLGAGADPVAVARSMAAPLPLFGGLQDGFAKL